MDESETLLVVGANCGWKMTLVFTLGLSIWHEQPKQKTSSRRLEEKVRSSGKSP